ncbi:hypothetical protein ACINWC743_A0754 [Acinetobacter sp. WC-743]|nr:hypothetical protein ACINWC743_A0754 [Acinetobacter sp. WC-743]
MGLGKRTQSKSYFSDLYSAWFLGILIQQSTHTDPTLATHQNATILMLRRV